MALIRSLGLTRIQSRAASGMNAARIQESASPGRRQDGAQRQEAMDYVGEAAILDEAPRPARFANMGPHIVA